ncbi:MAG: ABC transporter ATP-binding protein [Planctomycetota bacterium]
MIRLNQIHKSFEGRRVINGLTLHVERGETMVIIGGSGTGKSVSLKIITGIITPDSGDVIINGESMINAQADRLARIRNQMGVLFQGGALLNSLSVFDNVALPLTEHTSMDKDQIRDKVMTTLEMVDLKHAAHKMPSEISGGMCKRASLARAIIRDPAIILYDEPTSGLDPVMSHVIDNLTLSMQKQLGVTSIVVTHDMTSAYRVADRIAYLYAGEVEELGTPEQIRSSPNKRLQQFINGALEGPLTLKEKRP